MTKQEIRKELNSLIGEKIKVRILSDKHPSNDMINCPFTDNDRDFYFKLIKDGMLEFCEVSFCYISKIYILELKEL